jgi:hypothetical protein
MKTYYSLLLLLGLPISIYCQIPNRIHYPSVRTAYIQKEDKLIYPNPVLPLGAENTATLHYDDLGLSYPSYTLRIIHQKYSFGYKAKI